MKGLRQNIRLRYGRPPSARLVSQVDQRRQYGRNGVESIPCGVSSLVKGVEGAKAERRGVRGHRSEHKGWSRRWSLSVIATVRVWSSSSAQTDTKAVMLSYHQRNQAMMIQLTSQVRKIWGMLFRLRQWIAAVNAAAGPLPG